eukprot:7686615-Pyramimonas_sp.AAC.1
MGTAPPGNAAAKPGDSEENQGVRPRTWARRCSTGTQGRKRPLTPRPKDFQFCTVRKRNGARQS